MGRFLRILPIGVLLAAGAAKADDVGDQLDQARKLYESRDVAGAVSELEFAIEALKGQLSGQFLATFPQPPAGWAAEDKSPDEQAAMPFLGGGTVLGKIYRQQGGEAQIEATMMTGGSMLQGI